VLRQLPYCETVATLKKRSEVRSQVYFNLLAYNRDNRPTIGNSSSLQYHPISPLNSNPLKSKIQSLSSCSVFEIMSTPPMTAMEPYMSFDCDISKYTSAQITQLVKSLGINDISATTKDQRIVLFDRFRWTWREAQSANVTDHLEPDFDVKKYTMNHIRQVLTGNGIAYKSGLRRDELVTILEENLHKIRTTHHSTSRQVSSPIACANSGIASDCGLRIPGQSLPSSKSAYHRNARRPNLGINKTPILSDFPSIKEEFPRITKNFPSLEEDCPSIKDRRAKPVRDSQKGAAFDTAYLSPRHDGNISPSPSLSSQSQTTDSVPGSLSTRYSEDYRTDTLLVSRTSRKVGPSTTLNPRRPVDRTSRGILSLRDALFDESQQPILQSRSPSSRPPRASSTNSKAQPHTEWVDLHTSRPSEIPCPDWDTISAPSTPDDTRPRTPPIEPGSERSKKLPHRPSCEQSLPQPPSRESVQLSSSQEQEPRQHQEHPLSHWLCCTSAAALHELNRTNSTKRAASILVLALQVLLQTNEEDENNETDEDIF